ncbi:MAG TPA: ABC transporter ATP-binding protein [Jiangellaceae bacterium]|nr:ABC transporter ATP-binding protein [Jiangellaceae bacterium]
MPPTPTADQTGPDVPARGRGERPLLSVRNLKTSFFADEGTVVAVDGVSFDVHPSQTVGIVGETGCGKSVTARSILRIVEPPGRIVEGEILLDQGGTAVDLVGLPEDGRELQAVRGGDIALVFQEPMASFSPVHTIGNQITEAVRLHSPANKKEALDRAAELLRLVGVPRAKERLDEYPWQLSGGLQQRAMIAMALAGEPRLLIADEPTTALDVTTQAQILDLLRDLQERTGMAIILITHDLGVIAEMADDVVVMYLGRAVEEAPVDALFHAPRHPYTKALLRSIPSIHAAARSRLPIIAGAVPHPYERPRGCPFHPRCTHAIPGTCDESMPEEQSSNGHRVSCHLTSVTVTTAGASAADEAVS